MSETLRTSPGHASPPAEVPARWWHQPWWARITLGAVLVATAVVLTWNLARGGDFAFYEASARSMSGS